MVIVIPKMTKAMIHLTGVIGLSPADAFVQ
jgi:hypothetical protein